MSKPLKVDADVSICTLHQNGQSVVPLVLRVLRGEGLTGEEEFVMVKLDRDFLLAVAVADLAQAFRYRQERTGQ